ncbi:Phosphoglycolate phosphatase [Kingella potus]|uniref:Phosphoglycolate phosphatase n=1 Tax=Kingella potus TaxID=265175 RepID=A0A377R188_9NEIS|nr:HAD family hydrolase [Kingella potus]UOP01615.1 HAD family hydrolase [Kingella potus]STR00091.1 Phosphoglycolate phosphatase [Kingella potus]
MIKAVLFDLDGTLADTARDLGGALNTLLRRRALPEKSLCEIRPIAGLGAGALVSFGMGIGADHPQYETLRQEYLDEYGRCSGKDTVLFPQIAMLIAGLHERGILWGIVTNKHARFTDALVPKLGFPVPPAVTVSGDTCAEAKPSPQPLLYACAQLSLAPQQCLYVGDALRDILAGRNAGMKTVAALWGYIAPDDKPEHWGADFTAHRPAEIAGLL